MNSALKKIMIEHSTSIDRTALENDFCSNTMDNLGNGIHETDHGSHPDDDQWEDRMLKCRERNREHAKKTRLRKKVGIDGMKQRLLQLQTEVNIYYRTFYEMK